MPQEAASTASPQGSFPALTRYQRRVLWLLSQGNTVVQTAEILGTPRQSVTDSAFHARRKLGARSNAQAVLTAYIDGHIGPYEDCGTRETYLRHQALDEDACPACRRANREWLDNGQARTSRPPRPLTEAQVRLVRALHIGRTQHQLRILWGVSRSRIERMVTGLYKQLGVDECPRELRRERALEVAMEQGYLNPAVTRQPPPVLSPSRTRLTPTEERVLRTVHGHTLTETAELLGTERTTVSSHLNRVYTKLGLNHLPRDGKRDAALAEARRQGYSV